MTALYLVWFKSEVITRCSSFPDVWKLGKEKGNKTREKEVTAYICIGGVCIFRLRKPLMIWILESNHNFPICLIILGFHRCSYLCYWYFLFRSNAFSICFVTCLIVFLISLCSTFSCSWSFIFFCLYLSPLSLNDCVRSPTGQVLKKKK